MLLDQTLKTILQCRQCLHVYIGIASVTYVRHEIGNIQGRSPNVVKVIFHTIRNCSQMNEFAPSGSKFFPYSLREVPIFKRDINEENH